MITEYDQEDKLLFANNINSVILEEEIEQIGSVNLSHLQNQVDTGDQETLTNNTYQSDKIQNYQDC